MKRRVLHVVPDLGIGGVPRVIENLCDGSRGTDLAVSIVCLNYLGEIGESLRKGGLDVIELPRGNSGPDRLIPIKVLKIIRELRPQVVHTHNTQAMLEVVPVAWAARVPRIVHTDHGRLYPDRRAYVLAERMVSRLANAVVGVSEETVAQLREHQRISPGLLHVIPNGVSSQAFDEPFDAHALRSDLGILDSGPIIGLAARLVKEKGLEHLLRALPALISSFPRLVLLIAGTGELAEPLTRQAHELGVQGHVRFLGSRRDTAAITRVLDLYVLPSVSEGLPLAVLESMAAGRAIVASAVGGVPRAVENLVTGLLVPPGDTTALASAIGRLLSDSALRERMGAEARLRFDRNYTSRAMAAAYEKLYFPPARDAAAHARY